MISRAKSFLALTTPYDSIVITIIIAAGFQIIGGVTQAFTVIVLTAYFSFITGALNSLNHVTDVESDKLVWEGRPLAKQTLSKHNAVLFTLVLLIIAWTLLIIALTTTFSVLLLLVGLFDSSLPLLYSLKPFRLRRIPLLKNLVPPIHVILFPYLAVIALGAPGLIIPPAIVVMLLLEGAATLMVSDVVSVKGDERLEDRTLPMILGVKMSKAIIQGIYLLVMVIAVSLYLGDIGNIFWFVIIAEQTILIIISSKLLHLGESKIVSHASDLISVSVGTTVIIGFMLALL